MKTMTDREVADWLCVHPRTIRRLVKRTPPDMTRPWVRVGSVRRWSADRDSLMAWLSALEVAA